MRCMNWDGVLFDLNQTYVQNKTWMKKSLVRLKFKSEYSTLPRMGSVDR